MHYLTKTLTLLGVGVLVLAVAGVGWRGPATPAAAAEGVMRDSPGHHHAALPADVAAPRASWLGRLWESYVPRQQCMYYEQDVIWLNAISDLVIGAAYYSIPLALVYFVRRRRDLAFGWMFFLFAFFIVTCGTTHFFSVLAIWHPLYRLEGMVKALTAVASLFTAFLLWPLIPKALALPSPAQLRVANVELQAQIVHRQRAEEDLRRLAGQLEARVQDLKRSDERFRLLLDGAQDYAIFMLDPAGQVVSWNVGAERMFGWSEEQILEHPLACFFRPEDVIAGLPQQELEAAAALGRKENRAWRIRRDGSVFWANAVLWAIRESDGELRGFAKVVRDLTEQKRAEDRIQQANMELARSNGELQQFAYVASHDLQEPLRAIAGCVQLLQQRYQGQLDGRSDELIGHAVEGTIRMRTLIEDLLEYSRVGTRGHAFQPTESSAALQTALRNLQAAIEEKRAVITSDPLPIVPADPSQMTQLFQNLIGNALKFSGEGRPEVHIGAQRSEGAWQFSVRDNGIGIEPQYHERIFGIFQRLHTRREYPGTGIGLAVCKRIVERHGGRIWVESQPGQGTTFHFLIPERSEKT